MNPLFIAHLAADFLLQPKWLAKLKEQRQAGVVIHSLVHAVLTAACLATLRPDALTFAFLLGAAHGVIDSVKIRYQNHHGTFGRSFLLDQTVHFLVLIAASKFILAKLTPLPLAFWNTQPGIIILLIFSFFSFGVGVWNLAHAQRFEERRPLNRAFQFMMLSLIFVAYLSAAKVLAF
ncbi:MAG: DUF3307 domain-containing protein [Patescibacteria group bacterium]